MTWVKRWRGWATNTWTRWMGACLTAAMLLAAPAGAWAAGDTVFLSSDSAGVLWRIDVATGTATQIGSLGAVMGDIACTPDGLCYGAEFVDNGRLFRINVATGATAVIGTITAPAGWGLGADDTGRLFLIDGGGTLYRINTSTGAATSIGASGVNPGGDLAFSPDGQGYVVDGAGVLHRIDPNTAAATAVGPTNPTAVFRALSFIGGTLIGHDAGGVFRIDTQTAAITPISTPSPAVDAWGSATLSVSSNFLSSDGAGMLWRVDVATGAATQIGALGVVMGDIACTPDGLCYGAEFANNGRLFRIDPATGATAVVGTINAPATWGMGADPMGRLFMIDGGGTLYQINNSTGAATSIGASGVTPGGDLAFSADGQGYVVDSAGVLHRINPNTAAATAIGPTNPSATFRALSFVGGRLIGHATGGVFTIDTQTAAVTSISGPNPVVDAWGSATIVSGPTFLSADATSALWRVDAASGAATQIGPLGVQMGDIACAPDGQCYGAEYMDNGRLFRINAATGATTLIGTINAPATWGMGADPMGRLFMIDGGGTLYRIDTTTGAATMVGASGVTPGGDLAFSLDGQGYVVDAVGVLHRIDPDTAAATAVGPTNPVAGFRALTFVGSTLIGHNPNGVFTIDTQTAAVTAISTPSPAIDAWGSAPLTLPVDLAITKSSSPKPYRAGEALTYTIVVANNGPWDATGARVQDTLPPPFASFTWTCSSSNGNCPVTSGAGSIDTVVDLPAGASATFTVTGTVPADTTGSVANTARVTAPLGLSDTNLPNNEAPDISTASADLRITKSSTPNPYVPGSPLTYTITVLNQGPSRVIGARVQDTLPAALASFTWTCASTGGTCGAASGSGNIDVLVDLPNGASAVFTLSGTVPAGTTGSIVNSASVTPPPGTTDETPGDTGTRNDSPVAADVTLAKTGPAVAKSGGTVIYTLVVRSAGTGPAVGVYLDDPTPAGLTFVSNAGGCTTPFPCALGNLNPGQTVTVTATYHVNDTTAKVTVTNTATVTAQNNELSTTNNSAAATTAIEPEPATGFTRHFAEGATGDFWDETIALMNPTSESASVSLRFMKPDGVVVTHPVTLPAGASTTVKAGTIPGLEATTPSLVVASDQPVIADRTMRWQGAEGYGLHTETSIARPETTWYLAEGATTGCFGLFYLIQNPYPDASQIEVTYLLPAPAAPIVKTYTVGPTSRFTIHVADEDPRLEEAEVSAVIRSTNGIDVVVERAMYTICGEPLFNAGHVSAGAPALATRWFFAEGATGPFFDAFLLLANPNPDAAVVEVRYLLDDGRVITKGYNVGAQSRLTISVDFEDPALVATSFSAVVTSTNGVPVVAERAMWWPSPLGTGEMYGEGSDSLGVTETGAAWALAGGEQGGPTNAETYILIANTGDTDGDVAVTLVLDDGTRATLPQPLRVVAHSRVTVRVAELFPHVTNAHFGAIVESVGSATLPLAVERAVYGDGDVNGVRVRWAAGGTAVATRLR